MTSIRHNASREGGDPPSGSGSLPKPDPGSAPVPGTAVGTAADTAANTAVDAVLDTVLDAAREVVLAVGVRRTTLTEVARRAGLSRMTIYRRWPDVRGLVADLMTREWVLVAGRFATEDPVTAAVATVRALRGHPLWRKIVEVDPELLLPYLLKRRGASHEAMLSLVESAVARGQDLGVVRRGDPVRLAGAIMLTAQSFLLSGPTMLVPLTQDDLDAELTALLERYLRP
ncbi:TetR/AcrR family transcriptional regulator [Streptosporangium carneum]|uniref:TetR family transcriptional regulator n=1 Tax=Streptosporangium carneum TaxID=47481 RepID=A0A9W6I6F3_9ACTN|nr:TetR/AcrR family transcriptional regulator [Streptosporangium carneum]GLK12930.1 TetR family transcriptional regulator [Streptosporangium carneum]